jgi:hypothetical protein
VAFAPASIRTLGPRRAGSTTAIPGRSTPGSRRTWSNDAASMAPVLPAETTAWASPSATERTARTREDSGLARTARPALPSRWRRRRRRKAACRTRADRTTGCRSARRHQRALGISSGPRSPPRASTATRIAMKSLRLRSLDPQRLYVPASVRLAVRADVMRALRLAAGLTDLDPRRRERVLRAALVAPRPRRLPLGDGHERLRSIAAATCTPASRRSALRRRTARRDTVECTN